MSSLTGSKSRKRTTIMSAFTISLLVLGFAIVASAIVVTPAAFAQNATTPSGNATQGGNMTQGGNATLPTAMETNPNQPGNLTSPPMGPSGNITSPGSNMTAPPTGNVTAG
ncbi:MAG TPA: hypothetical protein VF016_06690 [Nitrososphaera sp.]